LLNAAANRVYLDPSTAWVLAGTGTIGVAGADGVWHAGTGVMNGAASAMRVDGAESPGTVSVTAGSTIIQGAIGGGTTTCDFTELALWSNYALTAAERTSLTNNQRAYWGF
jgi:hypothetical protein